MYPLFVVLQPLFDLGLSQAQDILSGVDGSLTAADVQEVQTLGSLVQVFLVAVGIAQVAERVSLDQSSSLSIVQLLANGLLHESQTSFPKFVLTYGLIIHISVWKSSTKSEEIKQFSKDWTMNKFYYPKNKFFVVEMHKETCTDCEQKPVFRKMPCARTCFVVESSGGEER